MKKFLKKNIKFPIMIMLVFSFIIQPVYAGDYDDQKEEANNQIYEAEKAIEELEALKSDVDAYIQEIDTNINQMNINIQSIEAQCVEKQQEIDLSNETIAQTEADIEQQYADMEKRIKYMYENADTQYVEMILGSESFSDFINKADFFSQLTTYDRNMVVKLEETKVKLEEEKKVLQEEMENLEVLKADAEKQKQEALTLLSAKETQMAEYETQIDLEQKEIDAQEAILAEIASLEKSGIEYTGEYAWPTDSRYISSRFGPRNTGIPGASTNHQGIDIAAGWGSTIRATASGTVYKAVKTLGNAAGLYVIINHGGGVYSYYFHCSSIVVNAGDVVVQGQKIANVGSTGISSGPHLHFGISINGSFVDPENYLP